jgi:hypothetical protein
MKWLSVLLMAAAGLMIAACGEKESERFILLTTPVWVADTLYSDGVDAGNPGELLYKFRGDAKFQKNGTGYFGAYEGKWMFNPDETKVTITSDSLPVAILANIYLLTSTDLRITAVVPNKQNLSDPYDIRMTFKAK